MSMTILLAPIGPIPGELMQWLAQHLPNALECHACVGEIIPLPETSYNPRRQQYRGEALLNQLSSFPSSKADRVLGLTDVDCYASGLNFIFGQAKLGGREAFIALPRLRQSFYGLPEKPSLFRNRVLKEALHELGHTWGLRHCHHRDCVMFFSNTLLDTDRKKSSFCSQCQGRLKKVVDKGQ